MTQPPTPTSPGPAERPLQIVFSLAHAGYLRHYADPIRLLAARGHSVHLALQRFDEKDRGDARLLERLLLDCPSVTVAPAPRRRYFDGWRALAWIVRGLIDVLRYAEPRYRDATALRDRTAAKVRNRVYESRVDPVSRRIVLGVIDWVSKGADPERARRLIRRLVLLEESIPSSATVDALLRACNADLVLASPVVEIGSPQVEFVKSARRRGIPSAVCVASWDNLTNKGLLRLVPDRVVVWNERQVEELAEMHGVPPERAIVTGGQKFDPWFALQPSTTREEFARRVGLDPGRSYVLYVCSSTFIAPNEVPFVRRWAEAVRADPRFDGLGILVRPHPQNAEQWRDIDLSDLGNTVIWPREGAYPDEGDAQAGFFDSLAHASAVVGVNTSAQIEAAIVGNTVYTILDPEFADTQEGTLHFRYLRFENGGFLREASSLAEHLDQLAADLADPGATQRQVRAFIERFVRPRGIDVPVTPIVAAEIEAVAEVAPSAPQHSRAARLATRAALTPIVLLMGIAALPLSVFHRLFGGGEENPDLVPLTVPPSRTKTAAGTPGS